MPPKSGATGPKPKKSTPKSTKTTELNNASEASPNEEKPSSSKKTSATKKVSATKKAAATPAKSSGSKKTSEVKTSSPKVSAEVKPEGAKAAASETKRSGAKKTTAKAASTTKKASGTKTTSTKATVAKSASVAKTAPAASPVKKTRTVKATAAKKTVTSKVSKTAKAKENDAVEAMVPTDNLVVPNPEVVPEIVEATPAVAPVEKVKKTRAVSKKTPKKAPKSASTTTKKTSVRRTRKPPTIGDTPLTPEQVEEFKNSLTGSYKFSVPSMLTLLEVFSTRGSLKDEEGMKVVGVETTKRYNEYRNFLFTGSLISYEQPVFVKTADLDALWTALRNQDAKALCNSLMKVPSFKHFLKGLKMSAAVRPGEIPEISKSAFPTYCTLVEITAQGLSVSSEGVYATPAEPSVEEFAKMAREVYKNLSAKKEKAVPAGLWLETIAKTHGVHPFVSRRLLEEAQEQNLLKYALEENVGGPSALPKKVTVYRIGRKENIPVLEQANLYSGDFFSANKIAVNLRLETKSK